jgi:hypothetical protein
LFEKKSEVLGFLFPSGEEKKTTLLYNPSMKPLQLVQNSAKITIVEKIDFGEVVRLIVNEEFGNRGFH